MSDPHLIHRQAKLSISEAKDLNELEDVRIALLGKKGQISLQLASMGTLAPEQRKTWGALMNQIKDELQSLLQKRKEELEQQALELRLKTEKLDVTLPARPRQSGRLHPIHHVTDELITIFSQMGFSVAEGPDIEDDFHNFTALNIAANHPARQMHDTFYFEAVNGTRHLLRTHTSPVQIRSMLKGNLPLRIIAPGRAYRSDSDMTHTPMFHQIEGLVIDTDIHMGHLKATIDEFIKTFFGLESVPIRFRPSFFPFTEPSAEVDIGCSRGAGELKIGAGKDWLEILGCGMVHPNVLRACNIDPNHYQGFAFGMGIERIAMLKYGIADLRTFFESDIRWLKHYSFDPLDTPSLSGGLSR